jgi:hypothetical protein
VRKPIAACPERALRALLPFGVVNPLFMGAADDAIRHDDRLNGMLANEGQNPRLDSWVVTDTT